MKPKSIRAAIQMMLPEVEEMLSLGVSREEVFKAVSERFGLENVNVRSFDTALYRARQNRAKHTAPDSVLHNTESAGASEQQKKPVLHNTEKPAKSEQVKKMYCTIHKVRPRETKRNSHRVSSERNFLTRQEPSSILMSSSKNIEVCNESSGY